MKIKDILPTKEKGKAPELYWSIIIEPGWVQAGIWRIVEDKAQIIFTSSPIAWELEEELVQSADSALSSAVQKIPEDVNDPQKTVFGVISSWVSEGEIKDEYLQMVKTLCTDLSLEPVGFVVLPEAISHYSKSHEGSPLNAVIVGIFKDAIEVSICKLGSFSGSHKVARSVSVFEDVVEGLSRFSNIEALPSRFILYDGKENDLEDVRQELHKADWDGIEKIKFLHTPKIETFLPDQKIQAVSLAGASEMADIKSVVISEAEEVEEHQMTSFKEIDGKDDKYSGNLETVQQGVTAEDLGFVLGEDIGEKEDSPSDKQDDEMLEMEEEKPQIEPDDIQEPEKPEAKRKKFSVGLTASQILNNVKSKFTLLGSVFGKIGKRLGTGKKPMVFGGAFLLVLLIGGFLAWWFLPKAEVTVFVSPRRLDERVEVYIDPNKESPDYGSGVLVGEVVQESMSSDKTRSTSGTKTVGEKATGEVTLYRVGPKLTFSSGTILTAQGNLKFSLNNQVEVASGSAGSPGETKVSVTAEDIGSQYNLASGTTFSVANYSINDIEGKNENSFSGGSSRDISAVSEDDVETLEKELSEELVGKVTDKIKEGLSEDKYLIEDSVRVVESDADFSNKEGDEATTLKLDLTIDVNAVIVSKSQLVEFAQNKLDSKIPDGFVLREEQIDIDFEFEDEDDGVFQMSANITANLLPEVDPLEIAKKIAGRYPSVAKEYLINNVPGFVRAEIDFATNLPGKLGTLPRQSGNIDVQISSER